MEIDSDDDYNYRQRSRTLPSESFSISSRLEREEWNCRKRAKSPIPRSMGNDAMSRALRQISLIIKTPKSSFQNSAQVKFNLELELKKI